MKKLGFVITGRMKSTRLNKKLILPLLDREVIAHMIDRAKLYFDNDEIVIATSNNPQDDVLEDIAEREKIKVYRGDEEDVVKRLYEAAVVNKFDHFINITADCPLFGYDYIDKIYDVLINEHADFVTSIDLPHGIFTYGVNTIALKKILEIKKTNNTEVWGDYFYNNPTLFKVSKLDVKPEEIREEIRLTLDYPEDYEFFNTVYKHFGTDTYRTSSHDLIEYLDNHPEVVAINKDCKALYAQRWDAQRVTNIEKK